MVAKNAAILLFQGATEPQMVGSVTRLLAREVGTFRVTVTRGIYAMDREVRVESRESGSRTFLVATA